MISLPPFSVTVLGNTHVRPDCTHLVPVTMLIERDPDSGLPTAL